MTGQTVNPPNTSGTIRSFQVINTSTWVEIVLVLGLLGLGLGLRLTNLTLDFHPTRQLRAAIIARGMYYADLPGANAQQRQTAIDIWATMERYEPPIMEHMVALTYRLMGSENLWVARVYSSLFWLIGGVALYGLVRRALSWGAGLFALGFYLILPWGVVASRAFQPDPWMVMWILLSAYAFYRWVETCGRSWLWTILSGLFAGLAILIKVNAGYPEVCMAVGAILAIMWEDGSPIRSLLALLHRPQVWVFALLSAIIPGVYYLGLGDRTASFASFWIFSFTGMLLESKFYVHWLGLIRGIVDVTLFFAALLGAFLFPRRARGLVLGLWLGYFLIGATFPYQIYTHDYYSLILVPIVAISLASIVDAVLARLGNQPLLLQTVIGLVLLSVAGYYAYVARSQLYATSYYRDEPIPWQQMGEKLPQEGSIVALTHDYGNRLKYYGWRSITVLWPSQGDLDLSEAAGSNKIADFPSYFKQQTTGMSYFLVTLFGDLDAQPALKAELYDHFPIAQKGDGYILFDLRHRNP